MTHPLNTFTACLLLCASALAEPGNRLLATGGVTSIEGSAGGGLSTWAVIAGYGTADQIGFTAYTTYAEPQDFWLLSYGAAVGLYDRLEISVSEQRFDLGTTVPNEYLRQQVLGVKWRLQGDAVFDQDTWQPQLALGVQFKRNADYGSIPLALGASDDSGVDFYLAATKLWLDAVFGRNVLANLTLRATKGNQFGLLGYGGDRNDNHTLQPELALGLFITDELLLGAEFRAKPDNLRAFREEDARDIFLTWLPDKRISLTAAWVDLGRIADKADQQATYLGLQLAF